MLKDETGIMFGDYNQPLALFNLLFALLKSKEYINKNVQIKGWYRRTPIPYIEIYTITMDGVAKKCHTYGFTKAMITILLLVGIALSIMSLI